jgi:hypothetical protein
MQEFRYKKTLVAVKITKIEKGSKPVTPGSEPLQMVTLKHPKGAYLKAHAHAPKKRITQALQECLIVRKGSARIDLYAKENRAYKKFKTTSIKEGDVLILLNGGYGIHITRDAELIEVKNGPFVEDKVLI